MNRHADGSNLGFFDGHVDHLAGDQIDPDPGDTLLNEVALWWLGWD